MTRIDTRILTLLVASVGAAILICDVTATGELVVGGPPAQAVVGRPLTPVSYAGVARRTSRRTTRRHMAAAGAYSGGSTTTVITTLPTGCTPSNGVYVCGSTTYKPYYDGPTIVYQVQ